MSKQIAAQGQSSLQGDRFQAEVVRNAGLHGFIPATVSSGTIMLVKRVVPWWGIVLCVVLFPIGLLFILVKVDKTATVIYTQGEGGTGYSISGDAKVVGPLQLGLASTRPQLAAPSPARPDILPQ